MQDLHQAPRARLGHHGEQRSSVGQYENRVAQSWNVVDDPDEFRDRMGVRNVLSGDALPPADFLSLPVPQHSEERKGFGVMLSSGGSRLMHIPNSATGSIGGHSRSLAQSIHGASGHEARRLGTPGAYN